MKEYYVYIIPDEHGKPCYVGAGKGLRINRHMQRARDGVVDANKKKSKYLISCIKRKILIKPYKIKEKLTRTQSFALEIKLIAKYGRRDLGTGCLFNCQDGGAGAQNLSPKVRNKITKALRVPTPNVLAARKEHSIRMTGRKNGPMPLAARRNISKSRMGWKPTKETIANMSKGQLKRYGKIKS